MRPANPDDFSMSRFPCWLIADEDREGALYGFPFLSKEDFGDPPGVKIAWHFPGDPVDPDHVQREITPKEVYRLIQSVGEYLPALRDAELVAAKTCLYANSADEDFIIDHLPGYDKSVTIACGFSGHGFKFASVIGEILADLALEGKTSLPIKFLSLQRFER
jgi:sarcosine oxidase